MVIPLYNAEKYIAETLDSLLAQTLQDFEVIVVNDCSLDSSRAIAESYIPKFGGRLKIFDNEKNSGAGITRNNGLRHATGEYVFFMDADDLLIPTGLEEMYTPAKDFDADVVYCEKYFSADDAGKILQAVDTRGTRMVTEPTLEPDSLADRVNFIIRRNFLGTPWLKLVRRKMLIENEIVFPHFPPTEDHFWTYGLFFFAKNFLRIPNAVYIYRLSKVSVTRGKRDPLQGAIRRLSELIVGVKFVDNMMMRLEFFQKNPNYRYEMLSTLTERSLYAVLWRSEKFRPQSIFEAIKNMFGDKLGEYDVPISMLCTVAMNRMKELARRNEDINRYIELIHKIKTKSNTMARADIKFLSTEGDFQIISVSDDEALLIKPGWLQNGGIGYQIESGAGILDLIVKTAADGQIDLLLRGIDVCTPNDNKKRIPYWVDYTRLTVNGKTIFDKVMPAWHDKAYKHKINAKAGEEITIQIKWLPHTN